MTAKYLQAQFSHLYNKKRMREKVVVIMWILVLFFCFLSLVTGMHWLGHGMNAELLWWWTQLGQAVTELWNRTADIQFNDMSPSLASGPHACSSFQVQLKKQQQQLTTVGPKRNSTARLWICKKDSEGKPNFKIWTVLNVLEKMFLSLLATTVNSQAF